MTRPPELANVRERAAAHGLRSAIVRAARP